MEGTDEETKRENEDWKRTLHHLPMRNAGNNISDSYITLVHLAAEKVEFIE